MKDFFNKLTCNGKAYFLTFVLTVLNILIILISGLKDYTFEDKAVSPVFLYLSIALIAIIIGLLIFLRVRRKMWIIKGLFIYEALGVFCYILFFVGYIGSQGGSTQLNTFYTYFKWWTLGFEPAVLTLSRFIGIPLKFTMGIFYLILTYFTASAYISVRKDINYEKQLEEDRKFAEKSENKHIY